MLRWTPDQNKEVSAVKKSEKSKVRKLNWKSRKAGKLEKPGDSRNKTMLAKVVVVANSKQKVFSWTQLIVKYTPKIFGYDHTLY